MASPDTIARTGRSDWTLMTAIHDALRRDLDQLIHTKASRAVARSRWGIFHDHLRFHLTAEDAVMWRPARARLAGDPDGLALLDAMQDEHQLIGPLRALTDDAFTMDADPWRLRKLMTRLQTRLTSHLAHKEADALSLISQIMTQDELRLIASVVSGTGVRRAAVTIPWALADATPDVCRRVRSQLPAPARLLYQTVWLPRYTRSTPPL
jgi:Hemerythrin HHE cation binding domain